MVILFLLFFEVGDGKREAVLSNGTWQWGGKKNKD